jgi:Tol biopolymer transport system component
VMAFNSVEMRPTSNSRSISTARYASVKMLIWSVSLDGMALTQYREGSFPQWAPAGDRIAFDHNEDLWLMNRDGTGLVQLTQTQKITEGLASFSRDGRYVLYTSDEGSRNRYSADFNIWAVRVDGTGKQQITSLNSWDSWPVDSQRGVYFLSGRGAGKDKVARIWRIGWSPQ